ncbi:glycosyl hydrolase family protein [bacterium]|nr:MAG: glycosyl hydrolase family protein [bacterium]
MQDGSPELARGLSHASAAVIPALEIWASPEPTAARIDEHNRRDQLRETGHAERFGDVELLASLGVSHVRYPVLWEQGERGLAWAAPRLAYLRARGISPIVTLLHHGSGPDDSSLIDPAFPERFARHARAVAQRFPWVERWTPVNEPLTTARFSTLYGHWYPNLVDDHAAFGRALTLQARAIILAMAQIRCVNPAARLMLTEDLQGFHADAAHAVYAQHLRERSFLSAEILMGRIVPGHPLWRYLTLRCAVPPGELAWLARHSTPPDLMGWNYYPHSERALLDRGGALRDVSAALACREVISPLPLLRAAYARLGLPLALSEVHLDGSAEERCRWLELRWREAMALRAEGVPLLAVGAWAAFGMVDWRSLLRRREGWSEDGVFTFAPADGAPARTAVAELVERLARGHEPPEYAPGWWEREQRLEEAARV